MQWSASCGCTFPSPKVGSGTTDTVDLILRPEVRVHGEVRMGEVAVSGAMIFALPRDVATSMIPSATSDAAGQFVLRLPPGVTSYDVVAVPRGFYVSAGRVMWQPKQFLRIGVGQDGGRLEVDAPNGELPALRHAGGEFPLLLLARESGGTVTSSEGRMRLVVPNLESGTYSVCVHTDCKDVFLPRFGSASVTIGR